MKAVWIDEPNLDDLRKISDHYAEYAKVFFDDASKKGDVSGDEFMVLFEDFENGYFTKLPSVVQFTTNLLVNKNSRRSKVLNTFTK